MIVEDFFKWLSSKGVNEKDCKTLSGKCKVPLTTTNNIIAYIYYMIENGITPSGFLHFDAEDFDDIGLTKLGKKLFLKTFLEIKGIVFPSISH
jgi:hypothetical protein